MNLRSRLQLLANALPPGGSVTFTRDDLLVLLESSADGKESKAESTPRADLTLKDAGAFFRKAPNTVRGWIHAGELDAYQDHTGRYRITWRAIEEYQERQRSGTKAGQERGRERKQPDLGSWRRLKEGVT